MTAMPGRLIGIARACERGAPMEELEATSISVEAGVDGDARGRKPGRQVTVLFRECWEDACREAGAEPLPWTTRRANLFVEGAEPSRQVGARLKIGALVLKVADETKPCALMEAALPGLRAAMKPDWRGGVCCDVVRGGDIGIGDAVEISSVTTDA
jgi:MOSC domain-containing protein YiiM